MGVFAFGMSGFSVNEEYTQENCDISRAAVYDYAIYHGHDTQTATNMANNYFWNCFQNGGSSVLTKVLSPYFN